MGLINKVKALWAARRVVKNMSDIKRGWKTISFWMTLMANIVSLAGALQGLIPATTAAVFITAANAIYNILRGLSKSQENNVRGYWKTTEFWLAISGEISKGVVSLETGGISTPFLASLGTVTAGVIAINRDLANKLPGIAEEKDKDN